MLRAAQSVQRIANGIRSRAWALFVLALIELAYWFSFTAGGLREPPRYTNYYDLLAEGFRAGHLYLPVQPDPRLLAQANPFDFRFRALWMVDVSLYHGKYFLYWGPVPALLQALAKSLLRINAIIGDQYLTFSFLSASAVLGALLFIRIAQRLFDALPRWMTALGIATFAFANPAGYLIATGGVYQAAICGGQAFMLLGLVLAFDAVWHGMDRNPQRWRLMLAGSAFGLALGCRVSLGPCVAMLIAITAITMSFAAESRWRSLLRSAIQLGAPVAIAVTALLLYNELRFDDWLEFGTSKQLTTVPLRMDSAYVPANLYSYSLAPLGVFCRFPYVLQTWTSGPKGLPAWMPVPPGYLMEEPVVGFLRAVPITWLLPFAIVAAVSHGLLLLRASRASTPRRCDREGRRLGYVWCAACFAVLGSVSGLAALGIFFATMRYLGDITFGLVALSLLGGYSLVACAPTRARRIVSAGVYTMLAASTIGLGLLFGYQGYWGQFQTFNPKLNSEIVRSLSLCERKPAAPASR